MRETHPLGPIQTWMTKVFEIYFIPANKKLYSWLLVGEEGSTRGCNTHIMNVYIYIQIYMLCIPNLLEEGCHNHS